MPKWIDPKGQGADASASWYSRYKRRLLAALDLLDVGSPTELFKTHVQNAPECPMREIWVPPRVRTVPALLANKEREWLRHNGLERDFKSVFSKLSEGIHILLGDPGAGKTTAAKYLGIDAVTTQELSGQNLFPLYAPLTLLPQSSASPLSMVLDCVATFLGTDDYNSQILETIHGNHGVVPFFILDGIDEIPERFLTESFSSFVGKLVAPFPNAVIVATCRIFDYLSDERLRVANSNHYLLTEFSFEEAVLAIQSWHKQADRIAQELNIEHGHFTCRGQSIIDFLDGDAYMQEFVQTPLLLNLLQTLWPGEGSLPRSVPEICRMSIQHLFIDRARMRRTQPANVDSDIAALYSDSEFACICWRCLRLLARRVLGSHNDATNASISAAELTQVIQSALAAESPEGVRAKGHLIVPLLKHFQSGHGILTDRNQMSFYFTHRLFVDVLAAEVLVDLEIEDLLNLVEDRKWWPAICAWASLISTDKTRRSAVAAFCFELYHIWEGNEFRTDYLLCASRTWLEAERRFREANLKPGHLGAQIHSSLVRGLIRVLEQRAANVETRILIGDALGMLGDTRIASSAEEIARVKDHYLRLDSICMNIGSDTPHHYQREKYSKVPWTPKHERNIGEFFVGRYPVTNGEYACFIEAGGYEEYDLWSSDSASAWVRQEKVFMSNLIESVRSSALLHFGTELEAGRISEQEINKLIESMLVRQQPLYWRDVRFNRPNQPVVGINWWEARAYCIWVGKLISERPDNATPMFGDLPTEFEWERCGRPIDDNRRFPWGNERLAPFPAIVRSAAIKVARTGAVGLFPFAAWENGPQDLVGNVWEWTRTKPHLYSSQKEVLTDQQSSGDRIVRGGSWLSLETGSANLIFRSYDPPCNAYEDLGFRVCLYRAEV